MSKKDINLKLTLWQQVRSILIIIAAVYGIKFILQGRLDIILDHPRGYGDLGLIILCGAGLFPIAINIWLLANHYCDEGFRETHRWASFIWYPAVAVCYCSVIVGLILCAASFFTCIGRGSDETRFCRSSWYFLLVVITFCMIPGLLKSIGIRGRTKWQRFLLLDHPFFDTPDVPFWEKMFKKKHKN